MRGARRFGAWWLGLACWAAVGEAQWIPWGPPAGDFRAVEVGADGRLLATVAPGDVYASTPEGTTWGWSGQGLPRAAAASALEADPAVPGRSWAAGPLAVYRSEDGGLHWRRASDPGFVPFPPAGPRPERVLLVAPPGHRALLFAGLGLGPLWRSVDLGRHWEPITGPDAVWFLAAAADGTVWTGNGDRLWQGSAGGAHFEPLAGPPTAGPMTALAVTASTLFVCDAEALWARPTAGGDWQQRFLAEAGTTITALAAVGPRPPTAGEDQLALGLALHGPFGLASSVAVSADGGATWRHSAPDLVPGAVRQVVFADLEAPTAGGGRLLAFGGRDLGASADGGRNWARHTIASGPSLAVLAAPKLHADPYHPGELHVVSGGRVFVSRDHGTSWQGTAQRLRDGRFGELYDVSHDPVRREWLWAAGGEGLLASRNRGRTWEPVAPGSGDAPREVLAMAYPLRQSLLAVGDSVALSRDRAASWVSGVLLDAPSATRRWTTIEVLPGLPRHLLLRSLVVDLIGGQLTVFWSEAWHSGNGGNSVRHLPVHTAAWGADGRIVGAVGTELVQSDDFGRSFSFLGRVPVGQRVRLLAVDPADPGHLLVLVEGRRTVLLHSRDHGATWEPANGGLTASEVLAIDGVWPAPEAPHGFVVATGGAFFVATWPPP
jgi:hypothetical protein